MRFLLIMVFLAAPTLAWADEPTSFPADQIEFFEKAVRPLLVQRCYECHANGKQQGGVRLDGRTIMVKGGEYGPVVVPGRPDDSRFAQVLRFSNDDVQMPPAGKLPDAEIAIFRKWIELGAPWPTETSGPSGQEGINGADARATHWAFQAVKETAPPNVVAKERVQTPIDAFILSKLEAKGLTLRPATDRYTFIRRVTYDLLGLPPTQAEVEDYVNDASPDATARLIDRLLDSPAYGEKWGRYWLDVARYADTKGYVFTEESRYPYAYTYRDYVIGALNDDKPINRFLMEQLAADRLEENESNEALAALGFLTVGRRFLNNQNDIIDDRIDVVSRGLLGLTVSCARCHDHKFDPVPTDDYYSLYGVFASSFEPNDLPVIGTPSKRSAFEAFQKELAKRESELLAFEEATSSTIQTEVRARVGDYLQAVAKRTVAKDASVNVAYEHGEPRPQLIQKWQTWLAKLGKDPHPVFAPWQKLNKESSDNFAPVTAEWLNSENKPFNPRVKKALEEKSPKNFVELSKLYGQLFAEVEQEWAEFRKANPEGTALPDAAGEELRQALVAEGSPTLVNLEAGQALFNRAERNKQRDLEKKIESLKVTSPGAPPRAMVMNDKEQPVNPRVLVRGNPGRPGKTVPRQFLEVVAGPERKPFETGSGRLDLAKAIATSENPLTARVFVNRVWQQHFDRGIVSTASDFGLRGDPPTHPELLDYLASQFMKQGWSLKKLHREILGSSVYQQASTDDPHSRQVDPENLLLWRAQPRRLDFEAFRDSLLAAGGQIDLTMGGRPYESVVDTNVNRRTVYGLVNRNDLPGIFRAFDFADPDASASERPRTTVPQQALFGLNSPFVLTQAKRAASRTSGATEPRVVAMYQTIFARSPTTEEQAAAVQFINSAPKNDKLSAWEQLAQILLLTNEFLFLD